MKEAELDWLAFKNIKKLTFVAYERILLVYQIIWGNEIGRMPRLIQKMFIP